MAAYAALMSLSNATDMLHQIIVLRSSTTTAELQQLESMIRESTNFLRSYLEKSCASQFEAEINDAADQAEGVIVRFVYEQLRSKSGVDDLKLKSLYRQMERIQEDAISSLVERINKSVCENASEDGSVGILDPSPLRVIPLARDEVVVGLEGAMHQLMDVAFERPSTELKVISIAGMPGIGKTTLARKVYNHITTFELFQVRGWVTVSKDHSSKDILSSLAASIQPYTVYPKQRDESIENHVRRNLRGRRFLIVLDDVWSRNAMDRLMSIFPDDGNSSRILLTSRILEVADPGKTYVFMMPLLSDEDCYNLLVQKVFQKGYHPPEFENLFKRVAYVCRGLALAVVLAAGILSAVNRYYLPECEYVCKKICTIKHDDGVHANRLLLHIFSLSYGHLPHHLRSCLLYLGAFPEDHEINVFKVTKQLLAQDFLRNSTISEAECVQDLARRNLVSVLKWKSDNGIKSICLHDIVRDFCLEKAQEENFLHHVKDYSSNRDTTGRKIKVFYNSDNLKRSFTSDDDDEARTVMCLTSDDADEARTVMCFGRGWTLNPLTSTGRCRLLQSLYLVDVEIASFPTEVLELFLLRLLALSHVPEIPPSISSLQYLETLMINPRDSSFGTSTMNEKSLPCHLCLPYEIWTMPRLRHIISFCCGPLPSPKPENTPLQNLETLSAVMNLDCSSAELMGMIPNVEKLGIFYFGVERSTHSLENIKRLRKLEKLKVWVLVPFSLPQNLDLGFPASLRKLTLRGVLLSEQDMRIVGQLPFLEVLKLRRNSFENDRWAVTADGFKNLKLLLLEELLGLRHWFSDDGGDCSIMQMLQTVVIRTCKELDEIPRFFMGIPSLELIEVVNCKNKSLVESAKRIKEQFSLHQNLEVRVKKYG